MKDKKEHLLYFLLLYVSVAGGVRIAEPAVDLPLALALASARRDVALPGALASFGEIGLAGEIRPVAHSDSRVREAARLGLTMVATASAGGASMKGIDLRMVTNISDAVSTFVPRGMEA
jgi:DNA repair protein RadA/Sms